MLCFKVIVIDGSKYNNFLKENDRRLKRDKKGYDVKNERK